MGVVRLTGCGEADGGVVRLTGVWCGVESALPEQVVYCMCLSLGPPPAPCCSDGPAVHRRSSEHHESGL